MQAKEIRKQEVKDLQKSLNEAKNKYLNLKFEKGLGKLKNSSVLKKQKREIAIIETVLREKEILKNG